VFSSPSSPLFFSFSLLEKNKKNPNRTFLLFLFCRKPFSRVNFTASVFLRQHKIVPSLIKKKCSK
jgi:hypothetical protein